MIHQGMTVSYVVPMVSTFTGHPLDSRGTIVSRQDRDSTGPLPVRVLLIPESVSGL